MENEIFISFLVGLDPTNLQRFTSNGIRAKGSTHSMEMFITINGGLLDKWV